MADDWKEKTEAPTQKKRDEARESGDVATSREVATFFVIMGGLVVIWFAGVKMLEGMGVFMKHSLSLSNADFTAHGIQRLLESTIEDLAWIVAPILIIPVFGVAAFLVQNGWLWTSKPLTPNLAKLNPVEGAKKIFSAAAFAELFKSLVKIAILLWVVVDCVRDEWQNIPLLVDMDPWSTFVYGGKLTFKVVVNSAWVLGLVALLDYVFQRWQYERKLRMSKEEVKEESKNTEGDPLVKVRIRSVQRQLARQRMMESVKEADVVVRNPTHVAVALKYDRAKMRAPKVVAKGRGLVAEKIIEIAHKHDVPVVENRELARTLFKLVEIGMEIPATLYRAVAELLAYVYSVRRGVRG